VALQSAPVVDLGSKVASAPPTRAVSSTRDPLREIPAGRLKKIPVLATRKASLKRLLGEAPNIELTATQLLWRHDHRLGPPGYLTRQAMTSLPGPGPAVALTFDDGPSKSTTEIVGILRRYGVHATFFFVGRRAEANPGGVTQVIEQGSEVGNHTLDHVALLGHSEAWDEAEITGAENVFYTIAGIRPVWVRPQAGWMDQPGIDAVHALNKRLVLWNDEGDDTVKFFTPDMIARHVLSNARPGSIILLHETNPRTVQSLPQILSGLRKRGLHVMSLGEATR
jgi:peptidoglycan/xylan/chitin deacetylase (PgdA/CDA1 family)